MLAAECCLLHAFRRRLPAARCLLLVACYVPLVACGTVLCCALCLHTTQTQSHRCADEFGTAQAAKKEATEAAAAKDNEAEAAAVKENEAEAAAKEKAEEAAAKKKEEAVRSLLGMEHVCAKLGLLEGQRAVVGHGDFLFVTVARRPRERCVSPSVL
jgi:uncharacterized membrane protein